MCYLKWCVVFVLAAFAHCSLFSNTVLESSAIVADRPQTAATLPDVAGGRSLTYLDALVLGIVEGVTEYLPISSTGHLILTNQMLGLNEHKEAVEAYAVVIQFGGILAVLFLYWQRVLDLVIGVLTQKRESLLLARNLIAAFIPAVVFGLLLDKKIEYYLYNPLAIAFAFAGGAILMLWIERWRQKRIEESSEGSLPDPDLHEISLKQSLNIGFLQCIAMWPGTSRSMMTIVGGYLAGFRPARAAEFSFLLGLMTLTAASVYKTYSKWTVLKSTLNAGPAVFGLIVATIVALVAVKWLVGYLSRHGFGLFALYRLVFALVLVIAWATGYFG